MLGDHGGLVAVFVDGIGQPGQDVPEAPAEQFVLAGAEQILQAVVGVGETPVRSEREEAVREPLDRGHGGHTAPGVEHGADQMGRRLRGARVVGHTAPQFDSAVTPSVVADAQAVREHMALLDRGAGGGPEGGQIRGLDPGRQGGRSSVELARWDPEDRAQLVVGREGSGVEVPVEQAHPYHRSGRQGNHHRVDQVVALAERLAGAQPGEGGAQTVGRRAQLPALRPRQPRPVRPGRPHHGHRSEDLLARSHRYRGGAERVGHGDRELGEAPHGLRRAGHVDDAPGAVRLRHRDTAVHRDPTPPAEQGGRRPARAGQYERETVAGQQEHTSGMRSRPLHGTDDGTDQGIVALGSFAGTHGAERVRDRCLTVGRHATSIIPGIICSILGRFLASHGRVPGRKRGWPTAVSGARRPACNVWRRAL